MQRLEGLLGDYEEKVLDLAAERARGNDARWEADEVKKTHQAIIEHVESMIDEAKDEALEEAASEGR